MIELLILTRSHMHAHTAIQRRNPGLALRLPDRPIELGLVDGSSLSTSQIVKAALSSFSPAFATALAAANGSFAQMLPIFTSANGTSRATLLSSTDNSSGVAYLEVRSSLSSSSSSSSTSPSHHRCRMFAF